MRYSKRGKIFLVASISLLSILPRSIVAGTSSASSPANAASAVGVKEESIYDRIWNSTELYHDESNSILQSLDVTGRFHGQYHWAESDEADDDGWETRRFRIGLEARMWRTLTLKVEMTSAPDFDPFFNGLSALSVQWRSSDAFVLTIGKQAPRFTWDYSTSSNVHPYIERSQLLNEFAPDRAPAISVQGRAGKFNYYAAAVSDAPSTEEADEFGSFRGGATFIAAIGYDVADVLHTSAADARLEYLHGEPNSESTIFNRFNNGIAASLALREGRASLVTEILAGLGSDNGDAAGLNLMPGWFATEKLQLVARYQIAASNDDAGLLAQRRYERGVGLPPGDLYQAAYAGFNYFIYGPRFRLMGGVEYAAMSGREVWTALLAVRMYWGPDSKSAFPVAYPFAKR